MVSKNRNGNRTLIIKGSKDRKKRKIEFVSLFSIYKSSCKSILQYHDHAHLLQMAELNALIKKGTQKRRKIYIFRTLKLKNLIAKRMEVTAMKLHSRKKPFMASI